MTEKKVSKQLPTKRKNKPGGGRPPIRTKAQVLKAIRGSGGTYSGVAERLKTSWICAKESVLRHPRTIAAFEAEREVNIDDAEVQLALQTRSGEPWAVKFTLATIGKKRGYTERVEVTGADGEPLSVEVEFTRP